MRSIPVLFFYYLTLTTLFLFSNCVGHKNNLSGQIINDTNNIQPLDYDKSVNEKYWKLTEINGKPIQVSDNGEPYLILKAEGNHLIGYGSCNNLNGMFELKDQNRIIFSKIVTTDIICPDMAIENSLLKVLQTAVNYNLTGDTLILNKTEIASLAKFEVVYLY